MFIDTSAIVAIIVGEPEADDLSDRIDAASTRLTSPLVRLEASMVLSSKLGREPIAAEAVLDRLLEEADITVMPITDEIAHLAVDAFQRFGKGRGKAARLNLSDCMSYACAKSLNEPILFVGRDFSHTDLPSA